jgi:caffeoyl-CoA O-methyltransferase
VLPIVKDGIEEYAAAHTSPPPPWLEALAEETTRDHPAAQMMVGPLEGRFLEALVFATGARRVLEIGTFTGYSCLAMAAALPPDGRVVTCDVDPGVLAVARRHIDASPYAGRIDIRQGPALDTIATLDGPYDLGFDDADKANYLDYYEAVLPKLADRGLIVVDNTLWSGAVLDPADTSSDTVAIRAFNDHVRGDARVVCVLLTIRDGVTLIRRSGPA